jgi:hypothetical protein
LKTEAWIDVMILLEDHLTKSFYDRGIVGFGGKPSTKSLFIE